MLRLALHMGHDMWPPGRIMRPHMGILCLFMGPYMKILGFGKLPDVRVLYMYIGMGPRGGRAEILSLCMGLYYRIFGNELFLLRLC
jgi:hypothetical protein